jgi:hypothetical protein
MTSASAIERHVFYALRAAMAEALVQVGEKSNEAAGPPQDDAD